MVSRLMLELSNGGEELTKQCSVKDQMVNFPVLSHGYSLVNFPRERAAVQIQKFGKSEYVR